MRRFRYLSWNLFYGGDEMDKTQRLRADYDALDKKLHKVIFAYNKFVVEQEAFNNSVEKNMQVIYDAFVKPELDRKTRAEKVIITPN